MVLEISRLYAICLVFFVAGFALRIGIEYLWNRVRGARKENVIEQCREQFSRLYDKKQQQSYRLREYCGRCCETQDCRLVRDACGVATLCSVCDFMVDYDHDCELEDCDEKWYEDDDDDWQDDDYWDDDDEPVGSCENCGTNLYQEDDDEFCDQCLWRETGGAGREE